MAQNPGSDSSTSEIDIDNLEVDILIVAKNPAALRSCVTFLTRRGWPCHVVNNVSQAAEYVASKKPDFVLISYDHASPAVQKLPDLLVGTLDATCVGFVETGSSASSQRLTQAKLRYKIFGTPSGPSVQRTIRRILAEKFNVNNEEQQAVDEAAAKESAITVRGSQRGEPKNDINSQQSGANRDSSTHVFQGESVTTAHGTGQSTDEILSNGKYTMGQKPRRSLKDVRKKSASDSPSASNSEAAPDQLLQKLKSSLGDEDLGYEHVPTVIEQAVRSAFKVELGEEVPTLDEVKRLAVFPLDSQQWPGYLTLALPQSLLKDEKALLTTYDDILSGIFKSMGVGAKVEKGFCIDFPDADFSDWVESQAACHFRAEHSGYEIGVAYFQSEKPLSRPEPLSEGSLYEIDIDKISTEHPVTFKAYLHLKMNQKYFLYLRSGRQFQPEQKTRLRGRKVKKFVVKSIDLENFRMFLAQDYLYSSLKKKAS